MLSIKNCPICGAKPVRIEHNLEKPNGRGYPGCVDIYYRCPMCKIPNPNGGDTIYNSLPDAEKLAIKGWNQEVSRIQKFLNLKRR
jgi:hypothetical protein